MKLLFVLTGLLISGCATDVGRTMYGGQMKNGSPIRFERLGSMTSEDISTGRQCGLDRVSLCTTTSSHESCRCIFAHDAERRIRQVVGQRRGPGG